MFGRGLVHERGTFGSAMKSELFGSGDEKVILLRRERTTG